jgi:predicted nucleic acid-binding protein
LRKGRRDTAAGAVPARVFVDSGGWIALLRARDHHHAEADRLFRVAVTRRVPLLTTNLVVAEVHRFLLFHVGIGAAARMVERLDASPLVSVVFPGRAHHDAARAWLAKLADQRITYTDAVSFAVMEAARCTTAVTFDHDFALAGFRLWQ